MSQVATLLSEAVQSHRAGALDTAASLYNRILAAQPDQFDALHLLGVTELQRCRPQEALRLIDRAVAVNGSSAAAYCNLGLAHKALGNLAVAAASFERALSLAPDSIEALVNRADLLRESGQNQAALAGYVRALALRPSDARLHFHRGLVLRALEQWDAALQSYTLAIRHDSRYVEAYCNRANVHSRLARPAQALDDYDRALQLQPDTPELHFNRGLLLTALGRLDDAIRSFNRAIELKPDYADAYASRGTAQRENLQPDLAVDSYNSALGISADSAETRFNRGIALLQNGQLPAGWDDYEWRWLNPAGSVINEGRCFSQALWQGDSRIAGRTVLLHAEQGLGDTLQFCRYVPQVVALGARVVLEVQRPLLGFLGNMHWPVTTVARGDELPRFDLHCPLMSLPRSFGTDVHNVPAADRYLQADPSRVIQWKTRVDMAAPLRVGLAWSGNPLHRADARRSIALAELLEYLPAGIRYYCLQTEVRDSDRSRLHSSGIVNFAGTRTFEDSAALCQCMDVIVTVDTSIAHLAGGLGVPTWVVLAHCPDWRWLLGREDCPWYSSARLYRQASRGDWTGVLRRVGDDLESLLHAAV